MTSVILKKTIYYTELNADSIEWCPIENYTNLFVCGTYELKTESTEIEICEHNVQIKKRFGCLYLFKFTKNSSGLIILLQQISMPGVLDSKWCVVKLFNRIFLALVNAEGELRILELIESDEVYLKEFQTIKLTNDNETLLLSLDWSTRINTDIAKIIVSDSSGHITLVIFENDTISKINQWKLHDFEAWIVAFNYWDTNIFFSGGDDCKLKCFDIRQDQIIKTNMSHEAGVTSLHMNPKYENLLISGSYDEHVRFWDIRYMKNPTIKTNVGGGVWRLKWEPKMFDKICASCMYFGSVILDKDGHILVEYKEHSSINYGIDWCYQTEDEICKMFDIEDRQSNNYHVIAICSFYDKLLSLALLNTIK